MSKKRILTLFLVAIFILPNTPAAAVLNGQVTQTGKYVIPVHSAKTWCSGVAISTRVVITNGHCTRENNVIFNDISVGPPGSNQVVSANYIKVIEVITEPGFTWDDQKYVPKDDIAFLILESDLPSVSVTRVATEADILEMRSKGEVLLLQGYGLTGEGPVANFRSTFPSNGYFSIDNSYVFDPTSISISSKSSSACNGDSGAPIIWENGKDAILLGVNVGGGGAFSNCRKASTDGIFRTEVQIPSRHSGILVNSIIKSSPIVGNSLKTALEEKSKLEKDLNDLKVQSALIAKQAEAAAKIAQDKAVADAKAAAEAQAKIAQDKAVEDAKAAAEAAAKIAQDKAVADAKAAAEVAAKIAQEISASENRTTSDLLAKLQSDFSNLSANYTNYLNKYNEATSQIEFLQGVVKTLQEQVTALLKPKSETIVCTKGSAFKVVKGIAPKCPVGYKRN